jgi:hypothetical protein
VDILCIADAGVRTPDAVHTIGCRQPDCMEDVTIGSSGATTMHRCSSNDDQSDGVW